MLLLTIASLSLFFILIFSKCRSITIPLFSVLFCLAIVESTTSLILNNNIELAHFDLNSDYADGSYYDRVPGFGYRPTPGIHTSRKLTSTKDIIYDVTYTIGSDGYRADHCVKKCNIFVYGGSFVFGEGLEDNETLTFFLNENHQLPAKNLGVHGYGLHQALYNIQQGLTSYGPKGINVLLTAPWHSLRSSGKPSHSRGTPRYRSKNNGVTLDGVWPGGNFFDRIMVRSNLFKLLRSVLVDSSTITDSDIQLYLDIVSEISNQSRENNSSLVIAYINSSRKELSYSKWSNESLVNELAKRCDILVDVTLADNVEEIDPKFYIHEFDKHPSKLANSLRAQMIADKIRELEISNL